MDEVGIRIGELRMLLPWAVAADVAAQLAQAGIGHGDQAQVQPNGPAEITTPNVGRRIADDDPMWSICSGGPRYDGPEWRLGDEPLARTLQDRLTRYTIAFHRTLVDHPGRLLSVEDLGTLTEDTDTHLYNNRVIAGAVAGYAYWCESIDRRFPFCWWEGRNGSSARYAMKTSVAELFRVARG